VCSVCEGALLLARTGLLDGHKATTHWAFADCLRRFPEIDVDTAHKRFMESGNRLTGGGISSGLDEALKLIALFCSTRRLPRRGGCRRNIFPQPPVAGHIPAAPGCMVQR
jgi:transcriptional regulator GlxA family with amidase domain